jgi:hypothetical protein
VANPRKYPKSPIIEWLEEEESQAPTCSRSARTLGAYVKIQKTPAGKSRRLPPSAPPVKPDPALAREPGGEAKLPGKQSQPASFDHLLKLQRLPKLRAPYAYAPKSSAQPAPSTGPKPQAPRRPPVSKVKR